MAGTPAQSRVQKEAENMLTAIEKEQIRSIQREAHLCAARCCEDQTSGTQFVQNCISKCFGPAQQAQDYINKEINNFQDRLTRCARGCQDKIQDKLSTNTSQSQAGKLQEEMNNCVDECCNSHCELLTKLSEKMKETILQARRPTST